MHDTQEQTSPKLSSVGELDHHALNITHLQLENAQTKALRLAGIHSIRDAYILVASPSSSSYTFAPDLKPALERLEACRTGNGVDWKKFWTESGSRFYHLSATLPGLDRLSQESKSLPVHVAAFGKSALPLTRAGYATLGQLCDGLRVGIPHVMGLGSERRADFFERLIEISETIDELGYVGHAAWKSSGLTAAASAQPDGANSILNAAATSRMTQHNLGPYVSKLNLGVLHLGQKAVWLRAAGFETVEQLFRAWPIGTTQYQNVGAGTIKLIGQRLSALLEATSDDQVDWDRYCEAVEIPLVPDVFEIQTGEEFLASLPDVLRQIAEKLENDLDASILLNRIAKPPGKRDTLDDLAEDSSPKITRERVRQREKQLLTDLANGIMWDDYGRLVFHFRPAFSRWWRDAAAMFNNSEDISFDDFIGGLSNVWRVSRSIVMSQAPIILSIVTGDSQIPASFRAGFRIDPKIYDKFSGASVSLKLNKLRLGKYAADLAESGIETVGDILANCRANSAGALETRAFREAISHLEQMVDCLHDDGAINWATYRTILGLEMLPRMAPASPKQFAAELVANVEHLLLHSEITPRAVEIFRLRSARGYRERLTLQEVADRLDTYGPSIKRDETIFLQFLNDLVIGQDFTHSPVWLDEAWLEYWRKAQKVYGECPTDFELFAKNLAEAWNLSAAALSGACPTLWAVLSGYPEGRRTVKRRAPVSKPLDATALPDNGRIRLVGFRRVH